MTTETEDKTMNEEIFKKAVKVAYEIVPEYATGKYACHGVYAKRWQAAYDAAIMVLSFKNGGHDE